jgi:hypothetical protein
MDDPSRISAADVLNNLFRSSNSIRQGKRIPNMNNGKSVVRPRRFSESELKRVQVEIINPTD